MLTDERHVLHYGAQKSPEPVHPFQRKNPWGHPPVLSREVLFAFYVLFVVIGVTHGWYSQCVKLHLNPSGLDFA